MNGAGDEYFLTVFDSVFKEHASDTQMLAIAQSSGNLLGPAIRFNVADLAKISQLRNLIQQDLLKYGISNGQFVPPDPEGPQLLLMAVSEMPVNSSTEAYFESCLSAPTSSLPLPPALKGFGMSEIPENV